MNVVLTPAVAVTDACGAVLLHAEVTGTAIPGVVWTVVEGATGGSIAASGAYTAPATPGTYHVVAASAADPTRTAQGTITVGPERVLSVAVSPTPAEVAPNGTLAFAATVTTTCGTFAAQ